MPKYESRLAPTSSYIPQHGSDSGRMQPTTKKAVEMGRYYNRQVAQMPTGRMTYEMTSTDSQSTQKTETGKCPTRQIW